MSTVAPTVAMPKTLFYAGLNDSTKHQGNLASPAQLSYATSRTAYKNAPPSSRGPQSARRPKTWPAKGMSGAATASGEVILPVCVPPEPGAVRHSAYTRTFFGSIHRNAMYIQSNQRIVVDFRAGWILVRAFLCKAPLCPVGDRECENEHSGFNKRA